MKTEKIGELAFIACVVIAVIVGAVAGLSPSMISADVAAMVSMLLVVLGVVVGFLNVSEKETTPFLIAAIALLGAGTVGFSAITVAKVGAILDSIVRYVGMFVAPGAILVALKAVYSLASKK